MIQYNINIFQTLGLSKFVLWFTMDCLYGDSEPFIPKIQKIQNKNNNVFTDVTSEFNQMEIQGLTF